MNEVDKNMEKINSWRKPAIFIQKTENKKFSKFGGLPKLPKDVEWPVWKNKPLSFLAQFDLKEIPEGCVRNGLPETGILYFFYENTEQTWGMYPDDRGSWRIIYSKKSKDDLQVREAPMELDKDDIFKEKFISFKPILTYPPGEDDRIIQIEESDDEFTFNYDEFRLEVYENKPIHHFWGFPTLFQNYWLEPEAELSSSNLNFDDYNSWNKNKQKEFEKEAYDKWSMLLQIESDEEVGFCWGDAGFLYFMIPNGDLKNLNFDNVWMLLQCG